jgi:hypothetical protein
LLKSRHLLSSNSANIVLALPDNKPINPP